MVTDTVTMPPVLTDMDCLHKAVCLARSDLQDGRKPSPKYREMAGYFVWDLFGEDLGKMIEHFMDLAQKIVPEMVEPNGDYLDGDLMRHLDALVVGAWWHGLTTAHIRMGGNVHMPYRLFPERSSGL